MSFHVLIPARLASSRLPSKPLADIGGAPMVVRVAQRALLSGAQSVCVAADDISIVDACNRHHIRAILTDLDHPSGSDRLAQACDILNLDADAVVVNVQGDEPLIEPELIHSVAECLIADPLLGVATAATPIETTEDWFNPNVVKVVLSNAERALYFSRSPIPYWRDGSIGSKERLPIALPTSLDQPVLRHIGIYAYRVQALKQFSNWPSCALEKTEALEQLRILWQGQSIQVVVTPQSPYPGVDTPSDLERIRNVWRKLHE
ncbi:MAG: hypothetical protein RLZZ397_953 [Pseudomonadota bacterium]|jgi:3-deoxy-manno-octulosonate cytidylyltransferase (CMP-KDO synthetase)